MHPAVKYDTFPLDDTNGVELSMGCGYPAIDTPAYYAGSSAFTPHIGEGINAAARNEFLCIRSGANDLVGPTTSIIHGVGMLVPDIADMSAYGTRLIWSPRSNITLYGDTARVTEFARLGVHIALGTDWMPTGSMNVLRELKCADSVNQNFLGQFFADADLWHMATDEAAGALGFNDVLGALTQGYVGDIAIFDGSIHQDYRAIIDAGAPDVLLVLRAGTPLYGEDSLVSAFSTGSACDSLTVCGAAKRACISQDLNGRGLASHDGIEHCKLPALLLRRAGQRALVSAGAQCDGTASESVREWLEPVRRHVHGGTTWTATEIMDAADNCPTVFNPIRPEDNGVQADFDQDHVGDACDPCPLVANSSACPMPTPGTVPDGG